MRAGIYRVLRIAVVAAAAVFGYRWLAPMGFGWVVPVVGGAVLLAWLGARLWRVRRERRRDAQADRWADALVHSAGRADAIAELRAERAKQLPKEPAEHAHLSLVLAELLEADGDAEGAIAVLEDVRSAGLTPSLAAVLRHARAVAHLSAGDPEAARATLDEEPEPSGDRAIDLRIRMMRGLIEAETGNPAEAKRVAAEARDDALDDEDLRLEARVLAAVAFDAAGQRPQALKRMRRLGNEMLEVLVLLGLPRVRGLAVEALEDRPSDS